MKRSRPSTDQEDPIPESKKTNVGQPEQNLVCPPLDVMNYLENWPIWKRQFHIYSSATYDFDQLTDQKRLSIFLNCLGKDGVEIAATVLNSVEAKRVTFEMVWSQFNDHYKSSSSLLASYKFFKTPIEDDHDLTDYYTRLRSAADQCDFKCSKCHTSYSDRIIRDLLVAASDEQHLVPELLNLWNPSSQDIISTHKRIRVSQKVWMDVLNYLCLCDMDNLAQMTPWMKQIVDNHVNSGPFGLQIQSCCLQKHPIQTDEEFYGKYKSRNTFLKIKNVRESDADQVLRIFTGISRLALYDMQIFQGLTAFPANLKELTITNSVIEHHILQNWLELNASTLRLLNMDKVEHSFCGLGIPLVIDHVENLRRLIVRGNSLSLLVGPHLSELSFIHIQALQLIGCIFVGNNVKNLILDVPNSPYASIFCGNSPSLKNLTIFDWPPPEYLNLTKIPSLENLLILSVVDFKYKQEIANLDIQNVLFTCESPAPPAESVDPDLIFELLYDDNCLLEIISYLTVPDWINFGLIHPISEGIVNEYKYPHAIITMKDLMMIEVDNFPRIAPFVENLSMQQIWFNGMSKFTQLKSLTLEDVSITRERVRQLPNGLEKLCLLLASYENSLDLTPYLKQLSSTLTVLEMDKLPNDDPQCLIKLRGLQELILGMPNHSSNHILFYDGIAMILKLNPGLKRLVLCVGSLRDSFWNAIGSLGNLTDLAISLDNVAKNHMKYSDRIVDLLNKVGPQLLKLKVGNIHSNEYLSCKYLPNIQELDVYIYTGLNKTISSICQLKSLSKLRINHKNSCNDRKSILIANAVILLVKSLPNLKEIRWRYLEPFPIKLGWKLQKILRESDRALRINSVDV